MALAAPAKDVFVTSAAFGSIPDMRSANLRGTMSIRVQHPSNPASCGTSDPRVSAMSDEDAARTGHPAEIQVGELAIAAIDLAVGRETIEVADFLAEARKVINDGGIVLLRKQLKDYGCPEIASKPQDDLYSLVESVGDCAAVPVSRLAAPHDSDTSNNPCDSFPCLLGQKAAIRYLSSYSDAALAPEAITESRPLKLDYDEYSQLWADDPYIDYGLGAALTELVTTGRLPGARLPPVVHESLQDGRRAFAFELGGLMARLHQDKTCATGLSMTRTSSASLSQFVTGQARATCPFSASST